MRHRNVDEQPRDRGSDERRTPKIWRTRAISDAKPVERERSPEDAELARMRANALVEISSAAERLRALPPPGALKLDGRDDVDTVAPSRAKDGGADRRDEDHGD